MRVSLCRVASTGWLRVRLEEEDGKPGGPWLTEPYCLQVGEWRPGPVLTPAEVFRGHQETPLLLTWAFSSSLPAPDWLSFQEFE